VKSSVEPLEGNKVKLYVEVDEAEFDRDIDRAFKAIAREVNCPGSATARRRAGARSPHRHRSGTRAGAARLHPEYLAKAVREHDVDLIATPEVEITGGQDDGPVEFDATCEVRPEITVPGYGGLRIELPSPVATDDEVDAAVADELRRHGTLDDVERPAATGDFVTLDLAGTRDGDEVAGLNTEDWSYEIGQGWVAESSTTSSPAHRLATAQFHRHPEGHRRAGRLRGEGHPGAGAGHPRTHRRVGCRQHRRMRHRRGVDGSGSERIADGKLNQARQQLIGRLTSALAGLVDVEPPEAMVNSDLQSRVQNTVQQFQAQGIDLEAWLSATGQDAGDFVESMRGQSRRPSRSTSRCAPWPLPSRSTWSPTRSRPSTPASPCRWGRRPRTSARPTSATTPCPS
jgi:trigger factor